jgi:hypothetical protein
MGISSHSVLHFHSRIASNPAVSLQQTLACETGLKFDRLAFNELSPVVLARPSRNHTGHSGVEHSDIESSQCSLTGGGFLISHDSDNERFRDSNILYERHSPGSAPDVR